MWEWCEKICGIWRDEKRGWGGDGSGKQKFL